MLRDQTEWMAHILEDESKCTVVPVVVPEELVVKETIDLVKSIRSQTKTDVSWVVLNRTEAPLVATTDEPTWVALREVLPPSTCGPLERAVRVRELQRVALDELKDAIDDLGYIVMPEIGGWGDDGSLLEVDTILVERLGEEL
jgi:anion-transporting  ArsA/GET3 family ATPase